MPIAGRKILLSEGSLANLEIVKSEEKMTSMLRSFFGSLVPPDYIDLTTWSDRYRFLPRETSAEFGRWRTSRFPFLRRIMDCLSPQSRCKSLVVIKGAQLGITETMINWIMYVADQNPGPIVYLQGTLDAVKDFNSQKLKPAIDATRKVIDSLGRDKGMEYTDSMLCKSFPGGVLTMGGANSDKFLRSKSVQYIIVDEEDTYKRSIGGVEHSQGSPLAMLFKRAANFPLSKIFRASTPVLKETSTIEPAFLFGSQEYYYVPCPYCNSDADRYGNLFVIKHENIKYSSHLDAVTNLPVEVYCECPYCKNKIFEYSKDWMFENGHWLSSKNTDSNISNSNSNTCNSGSGAGSNQLYEVGDIENVSLHISSFYSPLGFFSWRDAVAEWLEYVRSKDPALLQVYINQTCGETYSAAGRDISPNWLSSRVEDYVNLDTGEVVDVPIGVLALTAGVDVQKDRLECEIVGWGVYEESWSIDYSVFSGNTDFLGDENGLDPVTGNLTPWRQLSDHLYNRWGMANGCVLPVECTLIDAGWKPEVVHLFCKSHEARRVYPSKGLSGWSRSKGFITRPKRRTERFNTLFFYVYPDLLKDRIYQNLSIEDPGPGFCHFPSKPVYDHRYFSGLTSENREVKMSAGRPKICWTLPKGVRNEPLDCRCLAYAALKVSAINLKSRDENNPLAPPARKQTKSRMISPGVQ